MPAANPLQPVFQALWGLQASNYASVAATTILVYDILLNLGREIHFIWSSVRSIPKYLYIFVRYYGLAHILIDTLVTSRINPSRPACVFYFWWLSLGGAITFTTVVNCILMMRVYALFDRRMKVLYFLLVLFVAEFAAEMYISVRTAIQDTRGITPPPLGLPFPGCVISTGPTGAVSLAAWIPCLIVAVVFFVLTAYKFYDLSVVPAGYSWKSVYTPALSPLLLAFVRDGTMFFLAIAVVLTMSIILVLTLTESMKGIFIPWLLGTYSFAGSRLILKLREASTIKNTTESETTWAHTLSFRDPVRVELPSEGSTLLDSGFKAPNDYELTDVNV